MLIVRFSSIGDILLCTPVIRCFKQQKQAHVTFLTSAKFKSLLKNNPFIDEIVDDEGGIKVVRDWVQLQNFDLIIDLHKNRKSWLITFLSGAPVIRYDKFNLRKWWYVQTKHNTLPNQHLVDRYFEALASQHVVNDGAGLNYFIDPATKMPEVPADYNVLVMGAAHKTKRIPVEIATLWVAASQYTVVIIGGNDVINEGREIEIKLGAQVVNLTGTLSIDQSAKVLSGANRVLTGDTGMMHLAAALGKDIIVLWGNTTPSFGMFPYLGIDRGKWISKEVTGLKCRPCSKLGFNDCPKGHFRCMMDQKSESW